MNFDFVKEIPMLKPIYDNCCKAEQYVISDPSMSITNSRKSAETLAKFVAKNIPISNTDNMTFFEILSSSAFIDFISKNRVINAFHFIRKKGNEAVHTNQMIVVDDSILVLKQLHYIMGEVAMLHGLISEYPSFNEERLTSNTNGIEIAEDMINLIASKMYEEYAQNYDVQEERMKYLELRTANQRIDYITYTSVNYHEYLSFDHFPLQAGIIDVVQDYLLDLLRISSERGMDSNYEDDDKVSIWLELNIGNKTYNVNNISELIRAIEFDLFNASNFNYDCIISGNLCEIFYFDDSAGPFIRKETMLSGSGLFDKMLSYKRRDSFIYKFIGEYPDRGEFAYYKIENGKDIDVFEGSSSDIVFKEYLDEWYSLFLNLSVDFPYNSYPGVIEQLHDCVRKHIPKTELNNCEDTWLDDDPGYLCPGIQWNTNSLKDVQAFLDEVNRLIEEIDIVDLYANANGTWNVSSEFAIASWDWNGKKFQISGREL